MKRRVLVTGAAGRVARILMDATRDQFEFVCLDRRAAAAVPGLIEADLTDLATLERAAAGCDAMVHLGAHPNHHPDYPGVIVPSNLVGTRNAFEAAARAGVRRVVFASTVQVEFGWPEGTKVSVDMPAKPRNYYSGGKLFGEHLGYLYARDRGLSVICLRLGGVILPEREVEMIENGEIPEEIAVFAGDLAAILRRAIEVEGVPYAVLPAYSRNAAAIKDLEPLKRVLGYEPVEDARHRPAVVDPPDRPPRKLLRSFKESLRWGRLEEVRRLLAEDPRLAAEGGAHLDLLVAAAGGDVPGLTALLDADPARARAANEDGVTPLHVAGTPETARLLLDRGADPAARGGAMRQTPLAWCLDRPAVARVLADRLGTMTLHLAAALGDEPAVARLLDADASGVDAPAPPDSPFNPGIRPLHLAAHRGHAGVIRLLLARGADPDAVNHFGATALHTAAWRGKVEIIRVLVEGGARPDATDAEWSATPRDWAEESKQSAAAALLKEMEASPAARAAAAKSLPTGAPVVFRGTAGPAAAFDALVETDILGLWRALEAARKGRASLFTYEWAADPYGGWPPGTTADPETTPLRPGSVWAAVQVLNTTIVAAYGKRLTLPVAVTRTG